METFMKYLLWFAVVVSFSHAWFKLLSGGLKMGFFDWIYVAVSMAYVAVWIYARYVR